MLLFAPRHAGCETAGAIADKCWSSAPFKALAKQTAYRAGRLSKPDRWWIGFALR
jgi:hypothetical protein